MYFCYSHWCYSCNPLRYLPEATPNLVEKVKWLSKEGNTSYTHLGCRSVCRSSNTCRAVLRPSARWPHVSPNPLAKLQTNQSTFSSAQCISSIRQNIKSLCLCVSESVTEMSWTFYRLQFSTIFTKLAIKVDSQEMWLLVVIGGNQEYPCPPNRKWNNFHHYVKIALNNV